MGTVRITDTLVRETSRNIEESFSTRLKMARETLASDFGDRVYKYTLRKELKIMEGLPEQFFDTKGAHTFTFKHYQGEDIKHGCEFTQNKIVPYKWTHWRSSDVEVNNSALYDELKKHLDAVNEVENERNKVVTVVLQAMRNCTTLKQFLELMPEAEGFIPQHAIRKHYAKETRQKRENKDLSHLKLSDDDKIAIAKAKMSNF